MMSWEEEGRGDDGVRGVEKREGEGEERVEGREEVIEEERELEWIFKQ